MRKRSHRSSTKAKSTPSEEWTKIQRQLLEVREWARSNGRDFVEEFHERRRQERRIWDRMRAKNRR